MPIVFINYEKANLKEIEEKVFISWRAYIDTLKYPCDFALKVIGRSKENPKEVVLQTIQTYVPDFKPLSISEKISGKGAYLSVTVAFNVTSKEILDKIYRKLSSDDRIIMAL